jgi:hypothetical protein
MYNKYSRLIEIHRQQVLPAVLEDDEVGGVVHLNRPRGSHFCVVELWPLYTPLPLA